MRSLAWVAGGLGIAGALALRALRRQPQAVRLEAPPGHDPRAEELRRRLDESRTLVDEQERFEGGETTVDRAETPPGDPEQRRRAVHEQGRSATERMRSRPDRT